MSPIGGINQGSGYQSLYGKVASGKALQGAADGAAELAISEKMKSQVGGLEQGTNNASSGTDAIKIQDSALGDVTDYLQRIKELALAASNSFTATDSTLSLSSDSDVYKTAPMFFITNTDAVINLKNTKLSYGSGVLISAKATDEWGNSGSNGGNVTLNAENQTLTGNIEADSISTVAINLTNSTYEGTINADKSAKEVSLKLDKTSKIKLTGDSYVTSLDNADTTNSNIDFNGFTLYVNGKAVN